MFDVTTYGSGEQNVVLLHGMPVPVESLEPIPRWLGDQYRVLALDMTCVGVSFEESYDTLVATLIDRGVESAIFVGHSGGAYRALQLAIGEDVRAERILAIGALANLPDERQAQYDEMADAIEAGQMGVPQMVDVALELWFRPEFVAQKPEIGDIITKWFRDFGDEALINTVRYEMRGPDLHEQLSKISCPVELVVGDSDLATLPEWSREIANRLPNARVTIMEECGHFPHLERPEQTRAWLKGALCR